MPQLEQFLSSERQWPRRLRILYAQAQLRRLVVGTDEYNFWSSVLSALGATEKTHIEIHHH